jgi:hypothetical protein
LLTTKAPKHQKVPQPVPEQEHCWAADWDGWSASVPSQFPDWGPSLAAGPIMAALAGAGVGGAVGGITGALIGMGIPEYEAKRYEGRVKDGGILLSVHSDDSHWTKKAKEILERTGAEDISSTGEATAEKGEKARGREVA